MGANQLLDAFRSPLSRIFYGADFEPHSIAALLLAAFLLLLGVFSLFRPETYSTAKFKNKFSEKKRTRAGKIFGFLFILSGVAMFVYWMGWMDKVSFN